MNRTLSLLVVSFAFSAFAQLKFPALPTDLTPAQKSVVLTALSQAPAPKCANAYECLHESLKMFNTASDLAQKGWPAHSIAGSFAPPPIPGVSAQRFVVAGVPWSPVQGSATAEATIVMWLDFESPFSGLLLNTLRELHRAFPSRLRVVVRHHPMPFHSNARAFALMSMAAHDAGKFFEFVHALLSMKKPSVELALRAATDLGLDPNMLRAAVTNRTYLDQLAREDVDAAALKVDAAPISFLNGIRVDGAQPYDTWRQLIERELPVMPQ